MNVEQRGVGKHSSSPNTAVSGDYNAINNEPTGEMQQQQQQQQPVLVTGAAMPMVIEVAVTIRQINERDKGCRAITLP